MCEEEKITEHYDRDWKRREFRISQITWRRTKLEMMVTLHFKIPHTINCGY